MIFSADENFLDFSFFVFPRLGILQVMKRSRILLSLVKIPLDFSVVFSSFYIARAIRRITDLIPGVSLPIQTISDASLLKFAMA